MGISENPFCVIPEKSEIHRKFKDLDPSLRWNDRVFRGAPMATLDRRDGSRLRSLRFSLKYPFRLIVFLERP